MNALGLALCIGIAWGAVIGILVGIWIAPRKRVTRARFDAIEIEFNHGAPVFGGLMPVDAITVRGMQRACRLCGCTDSDCSACIERTGQPCHWVEDDLCSACAHNAKGKRPAP